MHVGYCIFTLNPCCVPVLSHVFSSRSAVPQSCLLTFNNKQTDTVFCHDNSCGVTLNYITRAHVTYAFISSIHTFAHSHTLSKLADSSVLSVCMDSNIHSSFSFSFSLPVLTCQLPLLNIRPLLVQSCRQLLSLLEDTHTHTHKQAAHSPSPKTTAN